MSSSVKPTRRRGYTRISAKHQVTIPSEVLRQAGLGVGDRMRVEVRAAGEVVLVRAADPIETFAGALTGVYSIGLLDELRREWD